MAKKKSSDDAADDGKKKSPAKKAAPKKAAPAAKKPAPKKPAPKASAKKKPAEPVEQTSLFGAPPDVIDAEILAETPTSEITKDVDTDEPDGGDADISAPAPLSDEERELSAVYGEDLNAAPTAHTEYQDRQTRDEDRPMSPEINARDERKKSWDDRRERRRGRDRGRDGRPGGGGGSGGPQPQGGGRPPQQQQNNNQRPPQGQGGGNNFQRENTYPPRENRPVDLSATTPKVNGHEGPLDGIVRVGTPLGDAVAAVFTQLRNGQPLPVRQLAAMLRKRNLVTQDPEQLWPQLKAELLGDERSYRTLGLRPRIVYRGRDQFAPGPVAMSVTAEAEAAVANALSRLASATHKAFAQRLARATAQGFERIIHAYLVAAGYREIEWVKRVAGISYASATAPGIARTVLISARSGAEPIDRRGIGELRVGVEAKDLVAGILMTPGELSEDAERELERAGRSIAVVCGDQLVAALISAGVGVVSSAAPLHYLDDQLLEEILAG